MAVKMERRGRERKLSYAKPIKKLLNEEEWHEIYART